VTTHRRGARDDLAVTDHVGTHLSKHQSDIIPVFGEVLVQLFDERGRLKDERHVDNLILTAGRNMIADRLLGSPTLAVPTHMSVGTSGTAPTLADTTITGEVRVALTSKTRNTNVVTMVGDWAAGQATQANQEAGLHDAASSGNLVGRATYGTITKGANDTL
jgi:hypothetical protein